MTMTERETPRFARSAARLLRAVEFAARAHAGQERRGKGKGPHPPYLVHPLDVSRRLAAAGVDDVDVLVAAVLHDVAEDTAHGIREICDRFGSRVGSIVSELTVDTELTKTEQKTWQLQKAPHMSIEAVLVKLADRTSNVASLVDDPPPWRTESMKGYVEGSLDLVDLMTDEFLRHADFELAERQGRHVGARRSSTEEQRSQLRRLHNDYQTACAHFWRWIRAKEAKKQAARRAAR